MIIKFTIWSHMENENIKANALRSKSMGYLTYSSYEQIYDLRCVHTRGYGYQRNSETMLAYVQANSLLVEHIEIT